MSSPGDDPGPSSSLPLAARTREPPPRLFHDFASSLIVFIHSCLETITLLPFPVGTIIRNLEELVDPWTHPFVEAVEGHALGLLATIDDQIYAVGTAVEGCILCTAVNLLKVPGILYRRGLIGTSADLWVKYEATLKENIQKAIGLASRVLILNSLTGLLCAISAPMAMSLSDWLVKQSAVEDKGIQSAYEDFLAEGESKGTKVQTQKQVADVPTGKVVSESKASDLQTQNQVYDGKAHERIEEIKEVENVDEPGNSSHQEANDLPDVLEMIDSGWLLGSAIRPTKKTLSPRIISGSKFKGKNRKTQ